MASCEDYLVELLKEIEPTRTQKDEASRSHNYLRNILDSGNMTRVIADSYLSGSYPRETAIRPLQDVDIIFVVDPRHWRQEGFGLFLSEYPSPEAVLKTFLNAIRRRYNGSSLRMQNKSVRLQLYHLDIDVVPAIDRGKSDGSLMIPDRHADEWIVTAPKKHSEIASDINRKQNGRFKPLVKLLKFWNTSLPSTAKLKSFAIETMACRLFQKRNLQSLEHGLLLFFDFIASFSDENKIDQWHDKHGVEFEWMECCVRDLANTGSNVVSNVSLARKKKFIKSAVVSRNRMLAATKTHSDTAAWTQVSTALRC